MVWVWLTSVGVVAAAGIAAFAWWRLATPWRSARESQRGRPTALLRYFVYVSDAKLEMLFEQIDPQLLHRLSAEAKVDLKLASLTIKKAERPELTRMAKLKVVERYIDRHRAMIRT